MPLQKWTTIWIESGAVHWTHKGRLAFSLRARHSLLLLYSQHTHHLTLRPHT